MKYVNDLTPPVIVLTGALNPSIFNPRWVARNIFGYEEGAVLNFYQAVYQLGDELRQLSVVDGVGWSVTNNRCEIFITSLEQGSVYLAEKFAISVVQTLLHTPWSSAGVNFQFIAEGDVDEFVERYKTAEGFEGAYQIGSQALTASLVIAPNLTLNVQRNVGETFSVFFNNHNFDLSSDNVGELIEGSINASLERCRKIMTDHFEMDEEEGRFLNPEAGEVVNVG